MKSKRFIGVAGLALLVMIALPLNGQTQGAPPDDKWTFSVQPYVWFFNVNGTLLYDIPVSVGISPFASAGSGGSSDATADVDLTSAVLANLNFAMMLNAEARKGRWSIFTDFVYLYADVQDSEVTSVNFKGPAGGRVPISASANLDTKTSITGTQWELAGSYTVACVDTSFIDILAGFRYFSLEAKSDANLATTIASPVGNPNFALKFNVTLKDDLWDGIIGVRGRLGLGSGKWGIPYYLDVGTGSSTFTFQAMTGIQYRFDWIDLNLVYRYLYYDVGGDNLVQKASFAGPAIGLNFRF
jgi:hypothetical protein